MECVACLEIVDETKLCLICYGSNVATIEQNIIFLLARIHDENRNQKEMQLIKELIHHLKTPDEVCALSEEKASFTFNAKEIKERARKKIEEAKAHKGRPIFYIDDIKIDRNDPAVKRLLGRD